MPKPEFKERDEWRQILRDAEVALRPVFVRYGLEGYQKPLMLTVLAVNAWKKVDTSGGLG